MKRYEPGHTYDTGKMDVVFERPLAIKNVRFPIKAFDRKGAVRVYVDHVDGSQVMCGQLEIDYISSELIIGANRVASELAEMLNSYETRAVVRDPGPLEEALEFVRGELAKRKEGRW